MKIVASVNSLLEKANKKDWKVLSVKQVPDVEEFYLYAVLEVEGEFISLLYNALEEAFYSRVTFQDVNEALLHLENRG